MVVRVARALEKACPEPPTQPTHTIYKQQKVVRHSRQKKRGFSGMSKTVGRGSWS